MGFYPARNFRVKDGVFNNKERIIILTPISLYVLDF